jgi:endonuclease/exonuclease/phosphatase (EEP) superfamily protein YafD
LKTGGFLAGRFRRTEAVLRWLSLLPALPAAAVCLAGLAAPCRWYGELACHWNLHAVLLLLPALAAWRWRPWVAGPLLAVLLGGLWPSLQHAWEPRLAPPAPGAACLRVGAGNLYGHSGRHAEAIAGYTARGLDLVVLVEILPGNRWLCHDWPHQAWAPNPRNGDAIALLSRHPLDEISIHDDISPPFIAARVRHPSGDLRVLACHPTAPHHRGRIGWRDRGWQAIAAAATASRGPLLVMGDLNGSPCTPSWSIFSNAGLLPMAGRLPATWPSALGPWGIPIDHVLGRGVQVRSDGAVDIPGSDHRGVLASVAIAP